LETAGLRLRVTTADTCGAADSSSSRLIPALPMCATVNNTPWPRYEGSVMISW
jgi:hypothetical protein